MKLYREFEIRRPCEITNVDRLSKIIKRAKDLKILEY